MSSNPYIVSEWALALNRLRATGVIGHLYVALPKGAALARRVLGPMAPGTTNGEMNREFACRLGPALREAEIEADEARSRADLWLHKCTPIDTNVAAVHDLQLLAEQDGPQPSTVSKLGRADISAVVDRLEDLAAELAEKREESGVTLAHAHDYLHKARCALVELAVRRARAQRTAHRAIAPPAGASDPPAPNAARADERFSAGGAS